MTGAWPAQTLDHIDGDRANNQWANLREASQQENSRNYPRQKQNSSGYKGVYFNKRDKAWLSYIRAGDGKKKFLGYFKDAEAAHKAYCEAADKYHGEFACYG